jgi:rubrerythrin
LFNKLMEYDVLFYEEDRKKEKTLKQYICSQCEHEFWPDDFIDDPIISDQILNEVCPICGEKLVQIN